METRQQQSSFEISDPATFAADDKLSSSQRNRCRAYWAYSLAVFFLLLGTVGPWQLQAYIDREINREIIVDSPDARGYARWVHANLTVDGTAIFDVAAGLEQLERQVGDSAGALFTTNGTANFLFTAALGASTVRRA